VSLPPLGRLVLGLPPLGRLVLGQYPDRPRLVRQAGLGDWYSQSTSRSRKVSRCPSPDSWAYLLDGRLTASPSWPEGVPLLAYHQGSWALVTLRGGVFRTLPSEHFVFPTPSLWRLACP
jgi:hypothetical protein